MLRGFVLGSRWVMAPFCLGLAAALLITLAQFLRELAKAVVGFPEMTSSEVILAILKLVDIVFVANLIVMVIAAGVELLMPRFLAEADNPIPGGLDFSALKLRVFASLSAIAAIALLESFVNIDHLDKADVLWEIVILLTFGVSGVLLAWMERLSAGRH